MLVGCLACAALFTADAPRPKLVTQGVSQLLARDVDRALAAGEDARAEASLFATLRPLAPDAAEVIFETRIDGLRSADPELARGIRAQWERVAKEHGAGWPRLRFGEVTRDGSLAVVLDVIAREDTLRLAARVRFAGAEQRVALSDEWRIPDAGALLPPLVVLAVALGFRRTLLALFLGIWTGATLLAAPASGAFAPLAGFRDVFRVFLRDELINSFRLEILGFVLALVALIGVVARAGGVHGLVDRARGFVRTPRTAQLLTAVAGFFLFFDDYANCVLVGNTMRPLTDRLRVSREKLAYLVDSTAAPVAAVSILSTWIAFQVSVFSPQLPGVGISESGYALFVQTLPLRFYCWFSLIFVVLVAVSGRDFGPMAAAEARARVHGEPVRVGRRPLVSDAIARMEPAPGMPHRGRIAAVPLVVTLVVTFLLIFVNGGGLDQVAGGALSLEAVGRIFLSGSGAGPILGGALAGLLCAVFWVGSRAVRIGVGAGVLAALVAWSRDLSPGLAFVAAALLVGGFVGVTIRKAERPQLGAVALVQTTFSSTRTLGFAFILLLEAWMIGSVCAAIGTAEYLVAFCGELLPPSLLPVLLFALASVVAFATGSSWSTMSILLPNVVALAAALGAQSPLGVVGMVGLCVSAVLDGAVFGDHCSPISDTTVLSSVASGSDHLDHVRTQAPYAALVATVAVAAGYLPLLWLSGVHAGAGIAVGGVVLAGVLWGLGRAAPLAPTPGGDAP